MIDVPTSGGPDVPLPLAPHPDLPAEQAHIGQAYERLEAMRDAARLLVVSVLDQGRGGTHQAREERDVIVRTGLQRLEQLDIGDRSLCFGRIDLVGPGPDDGAGGPSYHIGRLAVSGPDLEPLVVDWRAPVAEPFYRATGADPMGLTSRRHFATEGRGLLGIEDELFALPGRPRPERAPGEPGAPVAGDEDLEVPSGALLAAMERSRSGRMRDIVATVRREQDEVIRAPLPGLLVVQGGPGTGKTAVALHRAAYLLYTHRFPLEQQGVLVIGPNRLYLRYIEQVLPSLGENGVTSSTVEGLLAGVPARVVEPVAAARLKGEARMASVLAAAVRSRQRPPRHDLAVPFGAAVLRLGSAELGRIVRSARRRHGTHNGRRRLVESLLVARLAGQYRRAMEIVGEGRPAAGLSAVDAGGKDPAPGGEDEAELVRALRRAPRVAEALDRMWPRLHPEELLHDLYGAPPLIALAGSGLLDPAEQVLLRRPRSASLATIPWTKADIPLLDEARVLLGPVARATAGEAPRTYGHIVVDEAQDLSPMQLRMLARRSLSGSMTVVGDIAQATGPHAATSWDAIAGLLGGGRGRVRMAELSVNYRTPSEVMDLAAEVLAVAAPGLRPPRSVRSTGVLPVVRRAAPGELAAEAAGRARLELARVRDGTVAVVAAAPLVPELTRALLAHGLPVTSAESLLAPVTVLSLDLAKGLEFDAVVVVEPASIVEEHSLRALYVALTRATRRLTVLHARDLPGALAPGRPAASGAAGAP
ncbi:MAG: HelD family protein [Acidimicrobiales bacterium]